MSFRYKTTTGFSPSELVFDFPLQDIVTNHNAHSTLSSEEKRKQATANISD